MSRKVGFDQTLLICQILNVFVEAMVDTANVLNPPESPKKGLLAHFWRLTFHRD
jgi:hypothetical protein